MSAKLDKSTAAIGKFAITAKPSLDQTSRALGATGNATVASVGGTTAAPTITINESSWAAAITGLTTTSYLFRAGAVGTGAGGDGVLNGLDAWLPSHTGSPGVFLGVTRTNAPNQLAGNCLTATTKSPRQRIMEASQIQADTGASEGKLVYVTSTRNWEK